MFELIDQIDAWLERGERVAVATVAKTMGSSPRLAGAKMVVSSGEAMAGSVSGGCVEGAVFEACQEVLAGGPARLLHFGVADETAWEVGLACGGMIDVYVEPLQHYPALREAIRTGSPLAVTTLVAGTGRQGAKILVMPDGAAQGDLGDGDLTRQAVTATLPLLERGQTKLVELADGGATLLVESFVPPATLYMVGGVHISVALAALAKTLGFRTVVVDARAAFATEERFAHTDELLVAWPDEALEGRLDARSCVAVLTHDPKLDDPALRVALRSPARYIGALGSPTTHAKRLARLQEEGFSEADLARIHGPIGLPIGAKTPEEIALSILAEVVQAQRAG